LPIVPEEASGLTGIMMICQSLLVNPRSERSLAAAWKNKRLAQQPLTVGQGFSAKTAYSCLLQIQLFSE